MNITATLLAQIVAFVILIWLVNRLMWGPITDALKKRQDHISEGLDAAEKSKKELADAEVKIADMEKEARSKAGEIIANSEKRAQEIVEEAKEIANSEGDRIKQSAQGDIDQQFEQAKQKLVTQVAELAIVGAEKVLASELNRSTHLKALKALEERM